MPVFSTTIRSRCNAPFDQLEEAYVPGKTKAVMMAHTLGNPFDLERSPPSAASTISGSSKTTATRSARPTRAPSAAGAPKFTGTFGDLSTQSFYPPHHLTLGEGGAVNVVRNMQFKVLVESFRDWGRDCWCASGKDNTCGKRFGWQLGELPEGYDHKYIYIHLGYNLKPLDTQAAIGRQQLKKLAAFSAGAARNWEYLRRGLADLEEFFEFHLPTHAKGWTPSGFEWENENGPRCSPSWFGFMMLVRPTRRSPAPNSRAISTSTRSATGCCSAAICCGSRRSCSCARTARTALRVIGDMTGADRIMNESIFVGVYPGLTRAMLDYIIETDPRVLPERRDQLVA